MLLPRFLVLEVLLFFHLLQQSHGLLKRHWMTVEAVRPNLPTDCKACHTCVMMRPPNCWTNWQHMMSSAASNVLVVKSNGTFARSKSNECTRLITTTLPWPFCGLAAAFETVLKRSPAAAFKPATKNGPAPAFKPAPKRVQEPTALSSSNIFPVTNGTIINNNDRLVESEERRGLALEASTDVTGVKRHSNDVRIDDVTKSTRADHPMLFTESDQTGSSFKSVDNENYHSDNKILNHSAVANFAAQSLPVPGASSSPQFKTRLPTISGRQISVLPALPLGSM